MKRVLFLLVFAFAVVTSEAQNLGTETMRPTAVKGDPMLGTKDRTVWLSEHARIEETSIGCAFQVKCEGHIFTKSGMPRIGMYNEQDGLVAMSDYWAYTQPTEDGRFYQMIGYITSKDSIPGSKYHAKEKYWTLSTGKIFRWARENNGKLRIVITTYGGYIYDLTLMFREDE